MSLSLVIILIIVVWLIVLAPLLLRGQRPIHKAGEAYDETRVLHEGGTGQLASHRGPKLKPTDVREHDDGDYEVVAAEADCDDSADEEQLLIDEPIRHSGPAPDSVVDGEVVDDMDVEAGAEITAADTGGGGSTAVSVLDGETTDADGTLADEDREDADVESAADLEALRGGQYHVDDSYTGAGDFLHPYARSEAAATFVDAPGASDDATAQQDSDEANEEADLDEDDVAFAKARSGRGGWDPERDKQTTLDRYARRQRTLLGLGIFVAAAVILGLLVGGWAWLVTVVSLVMTVLYLGALRAQVRSERELRRRRIRHLRRARMGVRQSGVPKQLRRPGAVVMEIDDDSPDFDHLPAARFSDYLNDDDPTPSARPRFRAAG